MGRGTLPGLRTGPGLGRKGEKVTAVQSKIPCCKMEMSMVTKFDGGNGSATGLVAFDPLAKHIKSMFVVSGGFVGYSDSSESEWEMG